MYSTGTMHVFFLIQIIIKNYVFILFFFSPFSPDMGYKIAGKYYLFYFILF